MINNSTEYRLRRRIDTLLDELELRRATIVTLNLELESERDHIAWLTKRCHQLTEQREAWKTRHRRVRATLTEETRKLKHAQHELAERAKKKHPRPNEGGATSTVAANKT